MPVSKYNIPTFAGKIKEKYPQYKEVNDTILTKAIVDKHPEYRDVVDLSGLDKQTSPVDQGIDKTTNKVNQSIQFNGTFQPDLEGEKNGVYTNDPDYQKQKADFVSKIMTDQQGRLLYPEQDQKGNWVNYYTKEPIVNFDPHEMKGKILQVPLEYLPATGGKKFITPVYNQKTGSYDFPDVQTPDAPHQETLPEATVYGSKNGNNVPRGTIDEQSPELQGLSQEVNSIIDESKRQGGQFAQILKKNPSLAQDIDNTLKKYGDPYRQSLKTGSEAMSNILQKTVEDKFDLNKPLPQDVDPTILNGHLNVLNNFEKNRQQFEETQKELQRQADLIADKAKRTGQPISQQDVDALNAKYDKNVANWNEYTKAVKYAQNFVEQPAVKNYLDEFKKRQSGLQLLDEVRQRTFPSDINKEIKQDEYDRKAIEGNLNAWDYVKTFMGKTASGLSNIAESVMKAGSAMGPTAVYSPQMNTTIERLNNNAQQFIKANLPSISQEAIQQMDKRGMGHLIDDISSTLGGFAPYIIPGAAGEGLGAKAATFATALAESTPTVRKEAEKAGLTGSAYNTFITAKPLITAAFMTLLPNVKFAKGFDNDLAKSIVNGEFNSPKRFLLNMASKALKDPSDIAHLQAMLSGTEIGNNLVNQLTNAIQKGQDIDRGISRKEGLPVDYSNVINPRQTAVMALAGKVLETIPTLKNTIGDFRAGKDIAETYNHIQSNIVELAAHNLDGVSKQVDALVKKDPGNIYAQHLKNTLQDFAYAKAHMPEGLNEDQQAAIFSLQQETAKAQRQLSTADPMYQPHLQKMVDENNKQMGEIIKNPNKAIDYLKDSHKDLQEQILSPQTEQNGKETEANAQTQGEGVLNQPEGEGTAKAAATTPSYLLSRHADTKKDEEGKVSGPNQHPLSEMGKKDANDLATEVQMQADKTGIPITKIVHSGLERSAETANTVANRVKARTVSDPDLNTWAIGEFDDVSDDEFKDVQKWFGEHPDDTVYEGPIEKFKGKKLDESLNQYADRTIRAHSKYEGEPASTLLIDHSNNMMVMDAYRKNGGKWDEKAIQYYLNAEKPEPASLVKGEKQKITVSTPNIVNVKLKENVPIGQAAPLGTHENGDGSTGGASESSGVGSSLEGERPPGNGPEKKEGESEEKVSDKLPFGSSKEVGIAHERQQERAYDVKLTAPERGAGIELEQSIQRGRDLIEAGVDPEQVAADFHKTKRLSWEDMSVVRAQNEINAKATNAAIDKFGEDSPEAKAAIKKEDDWLRENVKPMQTEWSNIGTAQQGATDIDTGSVSSIRRAFKDTTGRDFSPEEAKKAKDLAEKVKTLSDKQEKLQSQVDKLMGENKALKEDKGIKESAKDLAAKIRKGKTNRPDMFSAATPASLVWDAAVEVVASAIEAGGALADAIAKGIEHIKESDWYKGLTDEEKIKAEQTFTDWHNDKGEPEKDLAQKYAGKKGNKFTPDEAREIWDYTKDHYLDKKVELPDAIKNVATDLGMTAEQIIHAIGTPKGAREITNEMFTTQYERRKAINSAKYFIANADKSKLGKALGKLPSIFFNLKTWGHGTVGNITHAGANIFRPSTWAAYWPNVFKSFGLAYGSTAKYEKAITILKSSPHFNEWLQAGLAADPNKTYDEYQLMGKPKKTTKAGQAIQWLNETGTRGFSGLNFMRYDMAEMLYNRASESAKADPELREHIAELVNHATGHSEVKVPKAIKVITFAPGLEISRWQRMITDPAKAAKTFANWKNSSPAEQAAAKIVAASAGEKIAMYGTLLAANAGLLSALGSKQSINLNDPSKSDWLRFKFGGKTLDVTGNVLSPYRLLSVLLGQAYKANTADAKDLKQKPGDKEAATLTQQARYKLSPIAGSAVDIGTGTDPLGNVLPWSNVKPATGKRKLTWKEFISQEALPIPVSAGLEAYWDSMRERGVPEEQANSIFSGLILFGTEGLTGAKLQEDYSLRPQAPTHKQRQHKPAM